MFDELICVIVKYMNQMLAIMMSIANVQERLYALCFTISLTHLPFISRLHLIFSDPLPPVLFRLSFSPLSWCLGMVMPTKVRFLSALCFATNGFLLLTSFKQYPSFFLGTERDMGNTAATRIIRCSDRRLLVVPLFLAVLLHAASLASADLNYTRYRPVSSFRLERIQKHLRKINKPPILTIESLDGDVIDCVPKRKQPALDHPLLKDHKIQRAPTMMPRGVKEVAEGERLEAEEMMVTQMWHRNGTRCLEGTIPIRRSTVHDVLRAKSLYHFGKKHPRRFPSPLSRRTDAPDVVSGNGHEHAIAYTGTTEEMYGARATINVWDPTIQVVNEFSLSQIWILSGSFDGTDLNSIEAGWQVSPELYGDSRPRLFTYWTSDSYQATGCYNLLCAGFVQTNSRIAIGAAISPVSSYASNQYDITILIWKDPKVGNWWMSFGDNSLVGYWPAELFTHLADHATMVEWGGEVVNTRTNSQHTSTQMGSGHFPGDGFGKASYFRNLEIVDTDNSLSGVQNIQTLAENTNCYDIKSSYRSDWGTYFYYGGPGRNPLCP